MFTRVDSVLIGAQCPGGYSDVDSLSKGDVALFDQNRMLLTSPDDAANAAGVYVGICGDAIDITMEDGSVITKNVIEYSNLIQKSSKPRYTTGVYEAPVEQTITIDASGCTIVPGNRYVIRIVYKDIYEHPGQFTHTYEIFPAMDDSAENLIAAFVAKINRHHGRRVTASANGSVLTLVAREKTDNKGVYSINEYSTVNMEASFYFTVPTVAFTSNVAVPVFGATIVKDEGTPGKGYWKQVRDSEKRSAGYKGMIYVDAYPEIVPQLKVTEGAEYDWMTIENDNLYLSPDNQYVKSTPLTTELYVESGSLDGSTFETMLDAFIAA